LISDELALVSTTLALRKLDLTFLGWSSNLVSLAFLSDCRILLFLVLSFDFYSLALEAKATPIEESTGVALASSASESKSKDNTKNNRIRRSLKKAKETKLEEHHMKVKSSLRKASVVNTRASSSEIKSVSNVNANLKCASCNGCLVADNHDICVVEYINSVNACRKSKSANTPVNRKVWK
nr:hypothetical protein [Tanacetum cinerariifolium]